MVHQVKNQKRVGLKAVLYKYKQFTGKRTIFTANLALKKQAKCYQFFLHDFNCGVYFRRWSTL